MATPRRRWRVVVFPPDRYDSDWRAYVMDTYDIAHERFEDCPQVTVRATSLRSARAKAIQEVQKTWLGEV